MTNLILIDPYDKVNITKTILNIDDWRVIGDFNEQTFYLTLSNCMSYLIQDFSVAKFFSMIRAGIDITVKGEMYGSSLICPICLGSGLTDWITNIVNPQPQKNYHIPKFKRDQNDDPIKTSMSINCSKVNVQFSQAFIPEAHERCNSCAGTGLYEFRKTDAFYSKRFKKYLNT
jgi:hypothetical protein